MSTKPSDSPFYPALVTAFAELQKVEESRKAVVLRKARIELAIQALEQLTGVRGESGGRDEA